MIKVGIVGPEESKWKTEKQKEIAKVKIKRILMDYWIQYDNFGQFEPELKPILVSGHCPKGVERIWCCTCNRWIISRDPEWHLENHIAIKVFDKGGVDTWAEIIATKLGIQKEIYPAVCNTLSLSYEYCKDYQRREGLPSNHFWLHHFKPRNIQIAEALDVGYCVVPHNPNAFCKHHNLYGHPSNGGCWTIHYAMKLGKEVELVVIK